MQSLDGNGPWCATEVDSDGKYIKDKWARCNQYCKKDEGNFKKGVYTYIFSMNFYVLHR